METRIAKLEEFAADTRERLVKIETRLEETATKSDIATLQVEMHKGFAEMIKWVVGTAIVLGGTALTVITFVLNNATPKAPPAAPLPPVVIYTQPAAPPAPKM
jgi:hypothetical protein